MSGQAVRLSPAARGWPVRFPDSCVQLRGSAWRGGLPFLPALHWSAATHLAVAANVLRIPEGFWLVPAGGGWFRSTRPAGFAVQSRVTATASVVLPSSSLPRWY